MKFRRTIIYAFLLERPWDNIHLTLQSMNDSNHYYMTFGSETG